VKSGKLVSCSVRENEGKAFPMVLQLGKNPLSLAISSDQRASILSFVATFSDSTTNAAARGSKVVTLQEVFLKTLRRPFWVRWADRFSGDHV
jgi:hypothetical protein